MPKVTVLLGGLLIVLGGGFFVATGSTAVTALIPAFFGVPVLLLGAVAAQGSEKVRMHTMHAAVMITLLGALAGLGMGVPKLLAGNMRAAPIEQALMGVICVVHVVLSVRSFIAARKARQAAEAAAHA